MRRSLKTSQFLLSVFCMMLSACVFATGEDDPVPTPVPTIVEPTSTSRPTPEATATPLVLPTAPATVTPQPTPTYDPSLAEWTIMVYMAADNNLELAALQDINEMEAAVADPEVNVLVQIDRARDETDADGDWRETRRYVIRPDDDPSIITSDFAVAPGELNMGEASTLNDFITWGITTQPANRYALMLWDHGAGWDGFAFDNDTNLAGTSDHLTLPELETAVSQALSQNSLDKLDVVAFDACLMGQLDVFHTLQPLADYAVGSEALTPGRGWNYETVLNHLAAEPDMDGAAFAAQLVADFAQTYLQETPDDFVTMSAVDLSRLPSLTHAVERLAAALLQNPRLAASAVGDARSGAESYARAYGERGERYAAMDLGHFAAILGQRSPDDAVREITDAVQDAIADALVSFSAGSGFPNSQGIAAYFPRRQEYYAPEYGRVTRLTTWHQFLNSYYDIGLASLIEPEVNLVSSLRSAVNVANPAYLEFEVVGREIETVLLLGGRYEEDGQRRLLEYDRLIPEPTVLPDGTRLFTWRDGLHEDFFVWDTQVTFLYDGFDNGGFVVMWPGAAGGSLFTVPGQFRREGGGTEIPASLVFDHATGQLVRVWGGQSGETDRETAAGAAEIAPSPGDTFQVTEFYLDANGNLITTPGGTLIFDDAGQLYFDWRPLPDGEYFLGFAANNTAGAQATALTDLTISANIESAGVRAYLDPYLGFQFEYPGNWYTPVYTNALLYTSNLSGTTFAQFTLYPNLDRGFSAQTLQEEALFRFGAVDVLFEDEVSVAGLRGLRTAYGYEREDGSSRTGIVVTFVHNNVGYVVDIDGPQENEAETITAVATLIDTWQFTGAGFGLQPGQWASFDAASFTIPKPADFVYQEINAWQRFSAGSDTFVALRTETVTRDVNEVLAALVRDAGNNVTGFASQPARQFVLGRTVWQRSDFSYTADGKEIWGFIMVRVEEGREIVAWAESPRSTYNDLEPAVFLLMIADLTLN